MMTRKKLKRDLTDKDVESFMKPCIDKFMAGVKPRVSFYADVNDNSEKKQKGNTQENKTSNNNEPSQEVKGYLESIVINPNLTTTGRAEHLGLSSFYHNKLKKGLVEKGLITEFPVNLGSSAKGNIKLAELTKDGYQAIGLNLPNKRNNNSSSEHWFWQTQIQKYFSGKGYKAEIEYYLNGKCADVGVIRNWEVYAYEVELSPKNVVSNIAKDIEAGFQNIVVACKNNQVKKAAEERINKNFEKEIIDKTQIMCLFEFGFVKELFK